MTKLFVVFTFVLVCCGALTSLSCGKISTGRTFAVSVEATPPKQAFEPLAVDPLAGASAEGALIPAARARNAPEETKGEWINSGALTLAGLKGRVVYIEFWTFGCYNCINTLPAVKGYDKKFRDKGLTVIGIETPEFDSERVLNNLVAAVKKRGIEYPVLTDYGSKNWDAYDINAWPTIVIIDKQGRIRYRHIGEGAYDTQERVIKTLLAE